MSVTTVSTIQQRVSQTSTPSRFATVARHAVFGGAIGAAGGAALSFTALPFIGALSAPLAAAVGGVAGLMIGCIVGIFKSRSSSDQARLGVGQIAPPPPGTGSGPNPRVPPPLPI